ncbi:GatB/YqeY domain-containing protein [Pelotalea chapellei]|uniref:GatB/YqeY domain-containing protein n=1 Tax=Pelotalea chapellei TaxID=44671 RepID=A0ABS5U6E0_9BACT|nr:GatB/YqeY domain-containing protein [Pelotalea chapellei]MBT1071229.1 GatB/YqeY domain-containing protein [Pelotalea chapellei]
MTLKEQITDAMKQAMKARDDLRLSVIRMIRSTVQNREIDQRQELDDQGIIEVVSTLVKQRRESIRLYQEGNRQDLVAKEEAELAILLGFLPTQLSSNEISDLVVKVIGEIGASGIKDMGRVMKTLTPVTAGRADGKVVSDMVKQHLS